MRIGDNHPQRRPRLATRIPERAGQAASPRDSPPYRAAHAGRAGGEISLNGHPSLCYTNPCRDYRANSLVANARRQPVLVLQVVELSPHRPGGEGPEGTVHVGIDAGDDLGRCTVTRVERGGDLGQPLLAMGYVVVER